MADNNNGMITAMGVLTARIESMDKNMSYNDYMKIVEESLGEENPIILLSALASVAAALVTVSSRAANISKEELLHTVGHSLSSGSF